MENLRFVSIVGTKAFLLSYISDKVKFYVEISREMVFRCDVCDVVIFGSKFDF